MSMLIRQRGDHFDNIVADAPSILSVADAPLLSRAVEGCIFVLEAEIVAQRGVNFSPVRL